MYKLSDWLDKKISSHIQNSVIIDVGAYHGNFTTQVLTNKKIKKAHLFEPNHEHFEYLQKKFSNNPQVCLYPYALGNYDGSSNFNCSQDDATGSLLPYDPKYHHDPATKSVKNSTVSVTTLDKIYASHFSNDKIALIKIDTQGYDLEVLKGAENLIKTQKPWLVIELNFLPFYTSQASINEVFNWLTNAGYNLGGFFNDHYSQDEWLSFADGIFIPESTVEKVREPFIVRASTDELLDQVQFLQQTCDERLNLIERLQKEADNRLKIIEKLQKGTFKGAYKKWYQKLFDYI